MLQLTEGGLPSSSCLVQRVGVWPEAERFCSEVWGLEEESVVEYKRVLPGKEVDDQEKRELFITSVFSVAVPPDMILALVLAFPALVLVH